MAMSRETIIRAWKDAAYRANLSAAEKTLLIPHPAGYIELSQEEMDKVTGGGAPIGLSKRLTFPIYAFGLCSCGFLVYTP